MLLLSDILDIGENKLRATSLIKSDNPFLEKQQFPCLGAIELAAQAAGILVGHKLARPISAPHKNVDGHVTQHGIQNGVVVQLKAFELGNVEINVGNELIISVENLGDSDQVIMASSEVYLKDHMVFKGSLMIAVFKGPEKYS